MKKHILIFSLIFYYFFGFSQITSYDWLRTMGNENDDKPILLTLDNNSCKLVTNSPGAALSDTIHTMDTILIGSSNYLFNYNNAGTNNSAFEIANVLYNNIYDCKIHKNFIYSTLNIYTNWPISYGSTTLNPFTGTNDIFIAKQDTTGNPIGMYYFGGYGDDYPTKLAIDMDGSIIIAGYYDSPSLTFAGTTIGNSGTEDAFIAKYDSLGNELWIKRIYSSVDNEPTDLVVDEYGNIYYIERGSVVPFNVGGSILPSSGNYTAYLLKFNANGNLLWNVPFGGDDANNLFDLEVDSSNNILLCGRSNSTTFLINNDTIWSTISGTGFNNDNSFLAKFNSSGSLFWSKYTNNVGWLDAYRYPVVSCDKDDNVYFSFHIPNSFNTIYFASDTIYPFVDNPDLAPFICKFSMDGVKQWITPFSTSHTVYPTNISVNNDFEIFVAGKFIGMSVQFDSLTSPGYFYYNGDLDVFLLKATQYVPDHTKHFVNLNLGWSIISSYVDPYVPDCDSVFADVATYMVLMKNEIGETFWPMYNVNTIGDLQIGEGYIIKMYNFNILEVSGIAIVPEWSPLALLQDWNIIGYLRQNSGVISTMLNDISQNIVMVKNGNGLIYWPTYGIDNIGNMNPGEGYQIKMLAADTLLYPAN